MEIDQPIAKSLDRTLELDIPQWKWLLSKAISAVMSPPLMIGVGLLFLAARLGGGSAYGWALLQLGVGVFLPALFIVVQVQRGVITDFHMKVREQRIVPLSISLLIAALLWWVMAGFNAPEAFLVFGGVATIQAGFMLLVTLRWKISGHAMTIASLSVFLVGILGWPAVPFLASIPLVAWARVTLSRHSRLQTIVGTLSGMGFTLLALFLYQVL